MGTPLSNEQARGLGKTYGATPRTIRRWAALGAPLDDMPAMLLWLDGRVSLPDATEEALPRLRAEAAKAGAAPRRAAKPAPPAPATSSEPPGSLRAARLEKLRLESERLRFQNDCERGKWIPEAQVAGDVGAWSALFRGEIEALVNQHAPLWAGLTGPQIQAAARGWRDGMLPRLEAAARRACSPRPNENNT